MHIIIDVILIAVFVSTVINGYRIGFIKSLISVCKFFISIAIAFALASHVGALISEKVVYEPVLSVVTDKVEDVAGTVNEEADLSEIFDKLPDSVKLFVSYDEDAQDKINGAISDGIISDESISELSHSIASGISGVISSIIAFLAVFAISMIALTILAFVLDKIFTLPVLKQANKLLGLIFGVFYGAFNVFAVCTVITLILHLIGVNSPELSAEAMKDRTVVYSLVENVDMSHLILVFFGNR